MQKRKNIKQYLGILKKFMENFIGIILIVGIIFLPIYFYRSFPGRSGGHRAGYAAFMTTVILLIIAFLIKLYG